MSAQQCRALDATIWHFCTLNAETIRVSCLCTEQSTTKIPQSITPWVLCGRCA